MRHGTTPAAPKTPHALPGGRRSGTVDGIRARLETGRLEIPARNLDGRAGRRHPSGLAGTTKSSKCPKSDRLLRHLLLLAALLLVTRPLLADWMELRQDELSAYKGWAVADFAISGLPALEARALRVGLAYDGEARWLGVFGRRRPALSLALLEQDLQRVRLNLARRGHPRAEIRLLVDARPRKRRLDLELAILPGPPAPVAALDLTGPDPPLDSLLRAELRTKPGGTFRDADFEADLLRLADDLRARGYARAEATGELVAADSMAVDVSFHVETGPLCRVAAIEAIGVAPDLARLAIRQLDWLKGRRYQPRRLAEVRDRLRLFGVYRQIRLELIDPPAGDPPGDMTLRADLAPRPPRTIEAGLGYWTAEGWRASAAWRHANLLRSGRGGEVRGTVSSPRQLGLARVWWPALFGRLIGGEVSYGIDRQRESSYRSLDRELRFALNWRPTLLATLSGGVSFSSIDLDVRSPDRVAFLADPGRLTSFRVDWVRDSSDDPFDPKRGTVSSLQVEWTLPGLWTDSDYLRLSAERSAYRSFGRAVGAARVSLGSAWPLDGSEDLLPTKRFYAGGSDHRGFGRRQLGPRDSEGGALGGEALALFSVELRFPVAGRVSGAVFVDTGQVWSEWRDVRASDLQTAVGPGLLVRTPVGPVRGDLGLRLGPGDDRANWAAHLSIGHPF